MGTINKQPNRYDVSAVYTHPDAKVDIVLVHGLNGAPKRTWTAKENGVYWPADLLPSSLKGRHANILVYGYNADVYSNRKDKSPSDNFIHMHAQTLVAKLSIYRRSEETTRNPIIWVAHSLGGILVKRALLYSNDIQNKDQEPLRSIYVSTYGIIFLGTPHTGSNLAVWGSVLQAMSDAVVPKGIFETESVLLRTLKKDNETLQGINNHFLDIYQRFRIHMVHENFRTSIKGHKMLVVDANSAGPQLPGVTYYGIDANHSDMCKYDSVDAPGYRIVSTTLRDWAAEAAPFIETRWMVEEQDRRMKTINQMHEMRMPYMSAVPSGPGQSQQVDVKRDAILEPSLADPRALAGPHGQDATPTPQDPAVHAVETPRPSLPHEATSGLHSQIFIHPESFRPNFHTVGRQQEMKELHRKLMDKGRRALGTSAVLIQCLPGGGKTHLAQQYVFKHKADYPNGIYWIQAKSVHEMEYWFWRIAKTEAIQESLQGEAVSQLQNPDQVVEVVREWFKTFDDWLLVFDGIRFDLPNIKRFIPDRPGTAIIYTSTDATVSGDNNFDSPQVMELPLLSAQEAQELLLTEMNKPQPWSRDDRERALELVRLMGWLPLMIHVAAQQLRATREPLSKYLRSYPSRQKAGNLSAYRVVYDQLDSRGDQNAALNLMSILVFFDSHIPVEMIALGLHALDKRTPWRTREASGGKSNLANTLKVLIMFALVDRVESDDISPASSRSSRQDFDRNSEYLDILRVHSVVQAFFIEMLMEKKAHLFWLERAVTVFCRAFDDADGRIHKDPKIGLPDDYRRFQIHGRKLISHVNRRLERLERKFLTAAEYQGLVSLQENLRERCDLCSGFIKELSHEVATHIVSGSNEAVPSSVFERGDSRSETDSASAPESRHSISENSGGSWTADQDGASGIGGGAGDDVDYGAGYQESPTELHPSEPPYCPYDDIDPIHFHVPYREPRPIPTPYPEGTEVGMVMPEPPAYDGDEDDRTEVPPVPSPRMPLATGNTGLPSSPPWQEVTRHASSSKAHRTVKRNERRRYHDHAGAWRDPTVSDPRNTMPFGRQMSQDSTRSTMTFSRQMAKGIIRSDGKAAQDDNRERRHPVAPPGTSSPRGAKLILATLSRLKDSAISPSHSTLASPATNNALDNIVETEEEAPTEGRGPSGIARPGMNIRPKSWASVAAGTTGRGVGRGPQDGSEEAAGVFSNDFLSSEPQGNSPSSWAEKTQNALVRFRDQIKVRASSSGNIPVSAGPGGAEGGGESSPSPRTTLSRGNTKLLGGREDPPIDPSGNLGYLNANGRLQQSPQRLHSPAFLGRRSARSSPVQAASAFRPPPPPPGSPPSGRADGQAAPGSDCPHFQALPGGGGPSVQRWESDLPYRQGRGHISSNELLDSFQEADGHVRGGVFDEDDPRMNMSRSMPSIRDGDNRVGAESKYDNGYSSRLNPSRSSQRERREPNAYRQSPYRINVHPPEAAYSPPPTDGYSSLPMSRNPSSDSQQPAVQLRHNDQYDRSLSAGLGLGAGAAQGGGIAASTRPSPTSRPLSVVAAGDWESRASSPHHQRHPSYPGDRTFYSRPVPYPIHAGGFYQTPPASVTGGNGGGGSGTHTPSDTRTEPSPRAEHGFFDVQTSYQRYGEQQQQQQQHNRRRRAGSASAFVTSPLAARLGRGGTAGSGGSRSSSRGSGRSPSQSPGPSGSSSRGPTPLAFGAPPGSSPDLSLLQQQFQHQQPKDGSVPIESSGSSPGFRLEDGRFFKFGEHSVDTEASRERVRKHQREGGI